MKSLEHPFILLLIGFILGITSTLFLFKYAHQPSSGLFQKPSIYPKVDPIQKFHVYASADLMIDGVGISDKRTLTGDCMISKMPTENRIDEIWTHGSGTWLSIYPLQMHDNPVTTDTIATIYIPPRPVKIETSEGIHYFATPENIEEFTIQDGRFRIQGKLFSNDADISSEKNQQTYSFTISGFCKDRTQ